MLSPTIAFRQGPRVNLQPSRLFLAVRRISLLGFVPSALIAVAMSVDVMAASNVDEVSARRLDWVPLEELTEEQKKEVPVACCGAYIAPVRDDPEADMAPEEANLFGSADSSESEKQTTMILRNNVVLQQGNRSISTDLFKLDQETSDAELVGNIQMREPGILVRAEHAALNIQNGNGRLDNAEFVMYETRVRGRAASLEKFKNNVVVLNGGMITGCEPGDNTWSIHGQNITIHNDERYGTAKNMRLNIKDVPIFYFPYVRFPVGPDRLTGFLFPSLSINSDGIDDVNIPFYWNIAPNLDATLEPKFQQDHGYIFSGEVRHLSKHFSTIFDGSYLFDDKTGLSKRKEAAYEAGEITEEEAFPYKGLDRWQYRLFQTGGLNQRWKTEIDYTEVSDTDYIRDIDRGAVDLNRSPYIRQKAAASYLGDNWMMTAKVQEMQLLTEGQVMYSEMPRINANGLYRYDDWVLELRNEYTRFDLNHHYTLPADNIILGQRAYTDYNIGWEREFRAGFIKPRVGVKTLSFALEAPNLPSEAADQQNFVTPQASLDTGLYFERDLFKFDSQFTHTFEPRIYYVWRDYDDQSGLFNLIPSQATGVNFDTSPLSLTYQQLFRDSRFAGGDRLDDTNQVTLGVTSRFINNESGIERLRLGLGQIMYLKDRKVTLSNEIEEEERNKETTSMLAGYIGGQVGDHFNFSNDITYDPYENRLNSINTSLRYMDDAYRIINVGYRYSLDRQALSPIDPGIIQRGELNQLDLSTIWPINAQWSAIARVNYDFQYKAELDTFVGVEYDDCCYRVRIMARQWVDYDLSDDLLENISSDDYDRGVFIELQLKGIGTISQKISRFLDKAIYGFSEREDSRR